MALKKPPKAKNSEGLCSIYFNLITQYPSFCFKYPGKLDAPSIAV
jgi:hypothetical protein